jgi:CRP-like cAMP-binding protein
MERYMILLKSFKRMPIELEQTLRENVRPMEVRKGEIIQLEETLTDNLYFIEKGLIRFFITRWDGQQVSMRFKREDEFIVALKAIFKDEQRGDGLEALEDGLLWVFPGPLIQVLKLQYHQFVEQYSAIIMKDWVHLEEAGRCRDHIGGESNYHQIQEYFPELLNRVPIQYLASFAHTSEHVFRELHVKNQDNSTLEKVRTTRL